MGGEADPKTKRELILAIRSVVSVHSATIDCVGVISALYAAAEANAASAACDPVAGGDSGNGAGIASSALAGPRHTTSASAASCNNDGFSEPGFLRFDSPLDSHSNDAAASLLLRLKPLGARRAKGQPWPRQLSLIERLY